jgi:hypothetical protein
MGDRTKIADALTLDSAIEVLKPLGPEITNRLAAAVTPHIEAMRAYDTGGECCYAPLSDRHIFPALVVRLADAGLLRADPDTSDELAAEARQLLDAANTAPRSHRCPDGMVDDVISWRCQCCGEWQVDFGPQTDCAAAPEPKMVHAPVRLIAALLERAVTAEADLRRCRHHRGQQGRLRMLYAYEAGIMERDAERAARERAEAEARQLREAIRAHENLHRPDGPDGADGPIEMDGWPCCNDDRLLWAAAVAEAAEDRGQTDG